MSHRKILSYVFYFSLLMLLLVSCGTLQSKTMQSPTMVTPARLLFVGNSLTYVNYLPDMFAELARSGGHEVEVSMSAYPNWRLSMHTRSPDTLNKIVQQNWDFVVLQEHIYFAAVVDQRNEDMYPAIRLLENKIRGKGSAIVLFMTWGNRDGFPQVGYKDFSALQAQIQTAYMDIADELDLMVAPVGIAWQSAIAQDPQIDLWQTDGIHPTMTGTYLAACVFYAVIYRQSPEGLKYIAELSEERARFLQAIAAETVLEEPGRWNLP